MPEIRYSKLESAPIRATIRQLRDRIAERFPGSGLGRVASELLDVAQQNDEVLRRLRRPVWWIRTLAVLALLALLSLSLWIVTSFSSMAQGPGNTLADLPQAVDAAINELIALALAVFF